MDLKEQAVENLLKLERNSYPGRGIIVGLDETGKYLVQVYWIMGRSENSRNRIFVVEQNGVFGADVVLKTAPFDPAKVKDSSLIFYTAMAGTYTRYAVSNGAQTLDALSEKGWSNLKKKWKYEPDAPNYTPRISGILEPKLFEPHVAELSILKKSPSSRRCMSYLYKLDISIPGLGYCITTYNGDGNPLPAFTGDPYLLPLLGGIEEIAQKFWETLNEDNKVSLAVRFIDVEISQTSMAIRNAHKGD